MAAYFADRRQVFNQVFQLDKARLKCTIYERWEDIELSMTARCGDTAQTQLSKTTGLTASESSTLKATLGSSLGVPKVAEIKSSIETVLNKSLCWEESETINTDDLIYSTEMWKANRDCLPTRSRLRFRILTTSLVQISGRVAKEHHRTNQPLRYKATNRRLRSGMCFDRMPRARGGLSRR